MEDYFITNPVEDWMESVRMMNKSLCNKEIR